MRSVGAAKMKTPPALSVFFALASGVSHGIELPLGFTEAPACAPAQSLTKKKATQEVPLTAIVEGENTEEPANVEQMQACANAAAKKVGLRLIAARPVEGNPLFKQIFLQCVEENRIPVNVYFVAMKSEDKCGAEEKNAR
jgi:hypothetical protein